MSIFHITATRTDFIKAQALTLTTLPTAPAPHCCFLSYKSKENLGWTSELCSFGIQICHQPQIRNNGQWQTFYVTDSCLGFSLWSLITAARNDLCVWATSSLAPPTHVTSTSPKRPCHTLVCCTTASTFPLWDAVTSAGRRGSSMAAYKDAGNAMSNKSCTVCICLAAPWRQCL